MRDRKRRERKERRKGVGERKEKKGREGEVLFHEHTVLLTEPYFWSAHTVYRLKGHSELINKYNYCIYTLFLKIK